MIEFKMPSLGADMEAGTLREWRVKPGDNLKRGDIIADVETQKGIIEVEVFDEGKVDQLLVKENEKVPVGTVLALIDDGSGTAKPETKKKEEPVHEKQEVPTSSRSIPEKFHPSPVIEGNRVKISPLARKIAEDNHIDYHVLKGTGEDGAIVKADVEKVMAQQPSNGEVKGPVKEQTSGIRAAIAAAMSKSNTEIPHYYLETRIDLTKTLNWLEETNKALSVKDRILPVAVFIKVIANALIEVPELNASWENGLQLKQDINPGLVISLRNGGVVIPALHHADKQSISEIMSNLNDIIPRAKALKLRSSELSDATITITSLGDNSSELVYGVIYPPQVALIGIGGIKEEPWAENGMLDVRKVVHVTLAGDHRATDGHTGDRFLKSVNNLLQHPQELNNK